MPLQIASSLRAWSDAALSLFYPEVCQICGESRATHSDAYVCLECRKDVRLIEPPFCRRCGRPYEGAITNDFECGICQQSKFDFAWARSAAAAQGPVLEAIHRYKYNRQRWFETFLADLLVHAAAGKIRDQKWDALIPVPLFPVKEREREFNQAERLAKRLGVACGIPVNSRLIKRKTPTPSQTRLTRKERAENMRGAFAMRRAEDLAGKRFLLIDDVFTTGATTNACAKVLRRAGAEEVAVWTVARGV